MTETEDDLYVSNKTRTDNATASVQSTIATPATMKLPNCGTASSSWVGNLGEASNPCPAGFEKGEQQLVKANQEADNTVYSARDQYHKSVHARSDLSLSNIITPLIADTCPDIARGFNHNGTDGGQYNIPQGWFYGARVKTRQNGMTVLECNYGHPGRASLRASSYAHWVDYILKDVRANRCTVQGATVTCRK